MIANIKCSYCDKYFSKKGLGSHIWRMHGEGKTFNPCKGRKPWNTGLTKETSEIIAQLSKQQSRQQSEIELQLNDDGKLRDKWHNKKYNAQAVNIEFNLSYDEYMELMIEANIKSSQLGYTGENYVLARVNDEGPYVKGNCRFLTQHENIKERKLSCKAKESSRRNMQVCLLKSKCDPDYGKKISEGIKKSRYYKQKIFTSEICKALDNLFKDKRFSNENNSQYGTFWITDGTTNMKWRETKGQIPYGFYKGRIINKPLSHNGIAPDL